MFSLQLDFKDLATLFDSHRCIITFYWFARMNAEVEGSWETLIMESVKHLMPWVEVTVQLKSKKPLNYFSCLTFILPVILCYAATLLYAGNNSVCSVKKKKPTDDLDPFPISKCLTRMS